MKHKWFVLIAGFKTGAPLWRLLIHDFSKFSRIEWYAYTHNFYTYHNGGRPQWVRDAFDFAWLHHQHHNPHHWQYWVLKEDGGTVKALPMPIHFVREMVADWAGAGRVITGRWEVREWYENNKEKMVMHETTQVNVIDALMRLDLVAL